MKEKEFLGLTATTDFKMLWLVLKDVIFFVHFEKL